MSLQKAEQIIEAYCQRCGITVDDLRKRYTSKYIARCVNGHNTCIIRMVLAYYLVTNFTNLYSRHIAGLLGYVDRSVISTHKKDVAAYLRVGDAMTLEYWNKLLFTVDHMEEAVAA